MEPPDFDRMAVSDQALKGAHDAATVYARFYHQLIALEVPTPHALAMTVALIGQPPQPRSG